MSSDFLVVADEAYGRAVPFACLERLCDAFTHKHADKAATVAENGLAASFGCVSATHCTGHAVTDRARAWGRRCLCVLITYTQTAACSLTPAAATALPAGP